MLTVRSLKLQQIKILFFNYVTEYKLVDLEFYLIRSFLEI